MEYDQRLVFRGKEREDIVALISEAEQILGDPLVWEVVRTLNKAYSKKAYHNGHATVVLDHNSGDSDPFEGYRAYFEVYGEPSQRFQELLDKKVKERDENKFISSG